MRKLLVGAVAAIAVVLIAALTAPFFIPVSAFKDRLVAMVKDKTGRDLRIAGPMRVSILPSIGLVAEGVSLSSPPGGFTADFMQAQRLEAAIKLRPLLHGAVEIDHLTLLNPKITFEIDKEGRRNWIFRPPAKPPGPSAPATRGGGAFSITAGTSTISHGMATYLDQRTGKEYAATEIDMTLFVPSLTGPVEAYGSAIWKGESIRLDATVMSPGVLRDGGISAATLKIASDPLNLFFQGDIISGKAAKADGVIELQSPAARSLFAWLGLRYAPSGVGFEQLLIKGHLDVSRSKLSLTDAEIALDKATVRGSLFLERTSHPLLSGDVEVDNLDLNPYLRLGRTADADGVPDAVGAVGRPVPAPEPPLARNPAPSAAANARSAATATAQPSPWSEARFDFAPLKKLDATLELRASSLRFGDVHLDKAAIALNLDGGQLKLNIPEMTLYHGTGGATVALDAGGALPVLATHLDLHGVTVQPLFRDIAGIDQVIGAGDISLDLQGQGANPREIVSSLAGAVSISLGAGTFSGTGFTDLIKSVAGPFAGKKIKAIEFSSLTATGTIAGGVLHNNDLKLASTKMSATGEGTVDLQKRQIDYLAVLSMAETAARISITGPWDDPSYKAQSVTRGAQRGKLLDLLR